MVHGRIGRGLRVLVVAGVGGTLRLGDVPGPPLEGALLAEALLVLERDGADLRELRRGILARGALDVEAAEVVHARAAGVARRSEPGEAHALGGGDRGQ